MHGDPDYRAIGGEICIRRESEDRDQWVKDRYADRLCGGSSAGKILGISGTPRMAFGDVTNQWIDKKPRDHADWDYAEFGSACEYQEFLLLARELDLPVLTVDELLAGDKDGICLWPWSLKHPTVEGMGANVDCLIRFEGKLGVIDLKFSGGRGAEYWRAASTGLAPKHWTNKLRGYWCQVHHYAAVFGEPIYWVGLFCVSGEANAARMLAGRTMNVPSSDCFLIVKPKSQKLCNLIERSVGAFYQKYIVTNVLPDVFDDRDLGLRDKMYAPEFAKRKEPLRRDDLLALVEEHLDCKRRANKLYAKMKTAQALLEDALRNMGESALRVGNHRIAKKKKWSCSENHFHNDDTAEEAA